MYMIIPLLAVWGNGATVMYDNPSEFDIKKSNSFAIRFAKFVYRFFDFLLPRTDFPFFGKAANKIRVHFARRISPGISKKATIKERALITNGLFVDDFGNVGSHCEMAWGVHIGKHVMMGPNCHFFTTAHPRNEDGTKFVNSPIIPKPIYVGDFSWLGYGCIILGGVHIGKGSTIAAGAVVTKDVPDFSLAAGNPAVIKKCYLKSGAIERKDE